MATRWWVVLIAVAECAPARSETPSAPTPVPAVAATAGIPHASVTPLPSVPLPSLALPSPTPLALPLPPTTLPLPSAPLPTPNIGKPLPTIPAPSLPVLATARLTFPVNPVPRGGLVTAIAASEIAAICSITAPWATLAAGQNLDAKRIDLTGQTSWIWTVGLTVTPGQQPVDLSCVTSGGNAGGRFFVSVN